MLYSCRGLQWVLILVTWMAALAILLDYSSALDGSGTRKASATESSSNLKRKTVQIDRRRLREGTQVSNESGYFRLDGDGATFVSDNGHQFGGLPNLNLERVVRILKNAEDSQYIRWTVNGMVTEFSERNFLLISRAIYKSVSQPPLPEQLQ